jgi:hypothetical protein
MQRYVNTTIEEEVFSIGPPRDYISSPVVTQKPGIKRRERVLGSQGLRLRQVVKEGVIPIIQSKTPLLFVTQP